jgi:hypothetical protein
MSPWKRVFAASIVASSAAAVARAQAPALNVNMGLWEITAVTKIGGRMPVDTSKLTPEQKARMEAAMQQMAGTSHTHVNKTCMTREKFNSKNFLVDQTGNKDCKQTLTTNTPTTLDADVVCTGEPSMKGHFHVDATSPSSFAGTLTTSATGEGNTMTGNVNLTGKWLGANCGDIK